MKVECLRIWVKVLRVVLEHLRCNDVLELPRGIIIVSEESHQNARDRYVLESFPCVLSLSVRVLSAQGLRLPQHL